MNSDRWQRLQDLFHEASRLAPGARAAFLDHECANDASLRAEVERLLEANVRASAFIDQPALVSAAKMLTEDDASTVGRRIGAYRLVRPIGRGGMGIVYLAERADGAFSQRVAIKLIKRGMDTDLVLARFRAERQILASLDHPNIARLLDGGTTDDALPYFAMEYIEGESIDTFAETSQLNVEGRLRLFVQVCDAVAYAHGRGVIHRDIKPVNTLVTPGGVPKLLDFGIAKVLHDEPGAHTTTVTGLRLLTPDYASPEQVEGRPATVTSDVYSLGVVLFELLTGRSPYRVASGSPQDVAAAVLTTDLEAPSAVVTQSMEGARVRRALPTTGTPASDEANMRLLSRRLRGDLDTIVLTAMRREPERRYASVAALADDIRRHLDNRPIAARGDPLPSRLLRLARRHRGPLTTAAIALMVVAAAAVWSRPRVPETPTLLSTQALAERDRLVVADFTDRTGDTVLAAAITEAIRTDLSQSPLIRVLTPRQVRSTLSLMQASPDVALDDSLARELAVREGVKAIVTGSLSQVSGAWTINVQLVGARDGETLAAVRETARDSTQLISAVDRASKALRRRIGESLAALEDMPSLWQATTASLPALRSYSEAQRLIRTGDRTAAVARFEEAIAVDTGFASAHLGLAMAYASMADHGRSEDASRRALAHQDRLPFLERSFLIASRAHANHDYEAAIRAYEPVVARYPENLAALNNLALVYRDSRRPAIAESLFVRASELDSTIANFLFGRHGAQVLQGRFREASATLDTLQRRFPDHPVYLTEVMQHAAAERDWPAVERTAWAHIERLGTDTAQLVDPYEALAQVAMVRGRLDEAERLWTRHARVARASAVTSRLLFGLVQQGYLLMRFRQDTVRALAVVDSALRTQPLDSILRADRRHDDLARFYLAAGRVDAAMAQLSAAEANDRALDRWMAGERLWTRGLLALAQGRVSAAIDTLRIAAERNLCTNCVYPDLGRALERAGRLRDAVDAYERYVSTPWLWNYEPDAVELAWTLRRLGDLQARLGDSAKARRAREELVELWKEADPVLRPVVDSARTRLRE